MSSYESDRKRFSHVHNRPVISRFCIIYQHVLSTYDILYIFFSIIFQSYESHVAHICSPLVELCISNSTSMMLLYQCHFTSTRLPPNSKHYDIKIMLLQKN